jgi:hypothetical protein
MLVRKGFGSEKGSIRGMARQRHTAEEIINKLREAEVGLARGLAVPSRGRVKAHSVLGGLYHEYEWEAA